jgi:hypothetical protein
MKQLRWYMIGLFLVGIPHTVFAQQKRAQRGTAQKRVIRRSKAPAPARASAVPPARQVPFKELPSTATTEKEKLYRFQKIYTWLEDNKLCLTGTSCPLWMSYTAHYLLGVAISFGFQLMKQNVMQLYTALFQMQFGRLPREAGLNEIMLLVSGPSGPTRPFPQKED